MFRMGRDRRRENLAASFLFFVAADSDLVAVLLWFAASKDFRADDVVGDPNFLDGGPFLLNKNIP